MFILRPAVVVTAAILIGVAQPSRSQEAPPDSAAIKAALRTADSTFREVGRLRDAKGLVRSDTATNCAGKLKWGHKLETYRDSAGVTRLFTVDRINEDRAWDASFRPSVSYSYGTDSYYYYDAGGRLRFAYYFFADVLGNQYEEWQAYDGVGGLLRRIGRWKAGDPRDMTGLFMPVPDPGAYITELCKAASH